MEDEDEYELPPQVSAPKSYDQITTEVLRTVQVHEDNVAWD